MNRPILPPTIVCVIILMSIYLGIAKIRAEESSYFGTRISQQEITLSKDESFILSGYQQNRSTSWILMKTGFLQNLNLNLDGFEDDVETCPQKTFQINQVKALCLQGYVGAHAQNVVLVDLDKFQPIAFFDDAGQHFNIISDVPHFIFSVDDPFTFVADMRDYDKNPLRNSIRRYFHWREKQFVFDKIIDITYDENYKIINSI